MSVMLMPFQLREFGLATNPIEAISLSTALDQKAASFGNVAGLDTTRVMDGFDYFFGSAACAQTSQERGLVLQKWVRPPLRRFFSNVMAEMSAQGLAINPNPDILDELTGHTLNLYEGYTQIPGASHQSFVAARDQIRIGRLSLCQDAGRVNSSLEEVRRIFLQNRFPVWEAIIIFHDVGKLTALAGHEKYSLELINNLNLLQNVPGLSPEDKKIVRAVARNHIIFGSTLIGDLSHMAFCDMFSSPEVKDFLLTEAGGVRTANLDQFLNCLLGTIILDVSGYGGSGYLYNTRVEYYLQIRNKLAEIFLRNQNDFQKTMVELEDLARGFTELRLRGLLLQWDNNIDQNVSKFDLERPDFGLGFYGEKVDRALQFLIEHGQIHRSQWQVFLNTFHLVRSMPYGDELVCRLAWSEGQADMSRLTSQDSISPWALKFLVWLNSAAQEGEFGP
ncbi:MAG: hypothetical protein HY979_03060, partial [Candidatus Magasanikbacteria bacterium]|nr:hypothetical protein [Candidatus Magasanikbacteria bacterium]